MTVRPVRYTARRKAQIVAAVRDGRISRRRAMHDHSISAEELDAWMADFDRHGVPGLRTTKLQYLARRRVWQ